MEGEGKKGAAGRTLTVTYLFLPFSLDGEDFLRALTGPSFSSLPLSYRYPFPCGHRKGREREEPSLYVSFSCFFSLSPSSSLSPSVRLRLERKMGR